MTEIVESHGPPAGGRRPIAQWDVAMVNTANAVGLPLLFGLRLWASVCLALYVAFWLQLDNAFWAGTSAALVCQPRLGASLRKGWFRMIGTLVGAVTIVMLTALFPQDRAGFLISLALWGAACALVATLLRNFAAYAAALAGYTAAIIASDQLGATGGLNGQAFMLAITRVSEIWIGIVCAGIVLAGTDFGGAKRRLAVMFAELLAEVAGQFGYTLTEAKHILPQMQSVRRSLVRRVIALDPVIDEAIGESSELRYQSPVLQIAVDGLFAALAGWRTVAARLAGLSNEAARRDADAVLRAIPQEMRSMLEQVDPLPWSAEPIKMRRLCQQAVQALTAMTAQTPSAKLLADQTVTLLSGIADALDGLALLVADTARQRSRRRYAKLYVPDWLPAFVNAARAFAVIGAAEVFWIVTAWPNGALGITWAAIPVILFAPRADEAYSRTMSFAVGNCLAAVCAAIVLFVVLPNLDTFEGFAIAMGLYLVPVGALAAQPWQAAMFAPMAGNLVPLVGPANQMSYDTAQFYNNAMAIIIGNTLAALSFRLLPPVSPWLRTERLLSLTLRDLRRISGTTLSRSHDDWEGRTYSRLAALPDQATPLQRAQLVAALSVGTEVIHLRRVTPFLGLDRELHAALAALADGNADIANASLAALDQQLAAVPEADSRNLLALEARGRILAVTDALLQHHSYFDAGVGA